MDDIDTAVEHFVTKPVLTALWWKCFLDNIKNESNQYYFVSGQMLKLNDKQIYKTENTIERDKMIVIPVDNWISVSRKHAFNNKNKVEQALIKLAQERMDRVTRLSLVIDDKPVQTDKRIISPMFEIDVNNDNMNKLNSLEVGHINNGKYFALSDGYWLFIEPNTLDHGSHVVETFGSCVTGQLELEIHHKLYIV